VNLEFEPGCQVSVEFFPDLGLTHADPLSGRGVRESDSANSSDGDNNTGYSISSDYSDEATDD
jgi:hypothetical protein